jgi:pimeloyl-ACP methyl ester carboxylesterase
MDSVRKYGNPPYCVALLHGGPGIAGEMKPVAEELSKEIGVLEPLQTADTVNGQIAELQQQLNDNADLPAIIAGYSWGAWLGFLFAGQYPEMVSKLILISAGSFEVQYTPMMMTTRFERLNKKNRKEAEKLLYHINFRNPDNSDLMKFGKLMTIADSFDLQDITDEMVTADIHISQSVWKEAAELRDSNRLVEAAGLLKCPVVAIHGNYDPHLASGVELPLGDRIDNFRMIRLDQCGHTPWKERHAKEIFFEILRKEIRMIDNDRF